MCMVNIYIFRKHPFFSAKIFFVVTTGMKIQGEKDVFREDTGSNR